MVCLLQFIVGINNNFDNEINTRLNETKIRVSYIGIFIIEIKFNIYYYVNM